MVMEKSYNGDKRKTTNLNLKGDITMKEYQHLIGKIIIATAIIVAAIIIAGAIDRAGANIQSGLGYLRDALLR